MKFWYQEVKPLHDGHRDRMKKKFLKFGADSFEEHELIEMLLYYGIPRVDTNELAHRLINEFGSIAELFDAPIESLMRVKGVGQSLAVLIKLTSKISRLYAESKSKIKYRAPTKQELGQLILSKFVGRIKEHILLILFNSRGKIIFCEMIAQGTFTSVDIYIRRVLELALSYSATMAIIAHNHPSGIALPSKADLAQTANLVDALKHIDVKLIDHIIVADNDYVSISESDLNEQLFK